MSLKWLAPSLLPAPSAVDIYLTRHPRACTFWTSVPYVAGFYAASILPRCTIPAGPVFLVTWSANSSTTPADTSLSGSDTGTTAVSAAVSAVSTPKLSAGKTAAAVLLPLPLPLFAPASSLPSTRPSLGPSFHPSHPHFASTLHASAPFLPSTALRAIALSSTPAPVFCAPCRPFPSTT
ncbi:hypothetical protein C8R44DRAFT_873760 [Mycena epipterygia]|nr:hypothetical protein C8R44DRAFT_873760 [Mycena epipterygia]